MNPVKQLWLSFLQVDHPHKSGGRNHAAAVSNSTKTITNTTTATATAVIVATKLLLSSQPLLLLMNLSYSWH